MSKLIVIDNHSAYAPNWYNPHTVMAYKIDPSGFVDQVVIATDRYAHDLAHHKQSNKDLRDYLATMGLSIDDYDAELDAWLDDYEPDNGDITARH